MDVVGQGPEGAVVVLPGMEGGFQLLTSDILSLVPSDGGVQIELESTLQRLEIGGRLTQTGLVDRGALSMALAEAALEAKGLDRVVTGAAQVLTTRRWSETFSYHCKGSGGGVRRTLDTRSSIIAPFFAGRHPEHGEKVLTPFGTAVFLGVAIPDGRDDMPTPMWHPSGSSFGVPWPMGHAFALGGGMGMLSLGRAPLELNGPTLRCPYVEPEDVSRYLHTTAPVQVKALSGDGVDVYVDQTNWIAREMFGVEVGALHPLSQGHEVVGVGVRTFDCCCPFIDLFVKEISSNRIVCASLNL